LFSFIIDGYVAFHGRSCATRVIVRLGLLLPATEFRPLRINAPDRASRLTPDRNPYLGMTFRSLETTARFRATFPRSMLLAYPFGSTLRFRRTRSITPLLHAIQFAPNSANSSRATRCPVPSQLPRLFFSSPLPLGGFTPRPIKAFKLITSREAHQIETPDLLRSPLPAVFK
jgi:hypothetical protein